MAKYIGLIKSKAFLRIAVLIVSTYFICMVIAPPILGGWSWDYVQAVWDRWQTFNAALLAFVSSVIAFSISTYNAEQQRGREFKAARAFLPQALSELSMYCRSSAELLLEAWTQLKNHSRDHEELSHDLPKLPKDYEGVFGNCIKHAEPNVGEYLASILMRLQIHHARLGHLVDSFAQANNTVVVERNVLTYLHGLGALQALLNKLFEYARGNGDFDSSSLSFADYKEAYFNLQIRTLDIDQLYAYTTEHLKNKK